MTHVAYYRDWLFGDVRLYENWGTLTAAHYLPYRDFPLEYPPGAIPIFISPIYLRKLAGYHETYYNWFRIELLVVGLLTIVVAAWALRDARRVARTRVRGAPLHRRVAPILLGPIALVAFRLLPRVAHRPRRRAAALRPRATRLRRARRRASS